MTAVYAVHRINGTTVARERLQNVAKRSGSPLNDLFSVRNMAIGPIAPTLYPECPANILCRMSLPFPTQ